MAFNRCSAICTTHGQQCPNGGCILHEGKWYCKKHDPHGGTMTRRTLQRVAPDLLAELKAILPMAVLGSERDGYCFDRKCEGCPGCQEQIKKARAAIRKAEGEL